jgi:nucleoside-diphosphate-sugar epimerase
MSRLAGPVPIRSTQTIIGSRTISPEMPAVVADQAMTSRSQGSMANKTRMLSVLINAHLLMAARANGVERFCYSSSPLSP